MGKIRISGVLGVSAQKRVVLGFAEAKILCNLSFPDILDEDTGRGYQRRFNPQHSLDFRKYIQAPGSSTIPLTLNLRPRSDGGWKLEESANSCCEIVINTDAGRVFAQVDCQHRLGHLSDLSVMLPFMCYIGLTEREEVEVFNVINSKAKGLSTSLLDSHEAYLSTDLANDRPELFIALHLNNDSRSPWFRQLDLGGTSTSGLMRRASLRTMQKAIRRFLVKAKLQKPGNAVVAANTVLEFWLAVSTVLVDEWANPRRHFLTKGIGVYALMDIAAELYLASQKAGQPCDKRYFASVLSDFLPKLDWSSAGPFRGFGGEGGVKSAVELIRGTRNRQHLKIIQNG